MNEDTFGLELKTAELAFVAGLVGASPRLLSAPFPGWSEEQVREALRQARQSLAARQYIHDQPDGSLGVETVVAALVGALGFAESALTVTCLRGAETAPEVVRLYYASGLLVEHEEREGIHHLTALRDAGIAAERLKAYAGLADQPASPGGPCTVPVADAHEAQCVAAVEGAGAAAELLREAGVPADSAAALAQAMADAKSQSTWLAMRWDTDEARQTDGFTLLEGNGGLWLLQPLPGDLDCLQAVPCGAADAERRIHDIIQAILPTP